MASSRRSENILSEAWDACLERTVFFGAAGLIAGSLGAVVLSGRLGCWVSSVLYDGAFIIWTCVGLGLDFVWRFCLCTCWFCCTHTWLINLMRVFNMRRVKIIGWGVICDALTGLLLESMTWARNSNGHGGTNCYILTHVFRLHVFRKPFT